MVVNARSVKRIEKRRVTADVNNFLTFPAAGDETPPTVNGGPFRTAVRAFLDKHALLPPLSSLFPHLLTSQIRFRVGDLVEYDGRPAIVYLDVVEEDVTRSRSMYCDQCRVVGWSSNPVTAKRYHFIIKSDCKSIAGYNKTCPGCGDVLNVSEARCRSCNHIMTTEDVEEWMYQQLENTSHLLHGVIHSNGFGHLLRVNGREGGSRVLSGRQIMSFWDRICKMLGVREVSVMDVSKKSGLEYRLLHSIVKGNPWYGEWGYQFGAGSFSLTVDDYNTAVKDLSSLPLTLFQSQGRKIRTPLQNMISYYQSISEKELVNIKDLFCFLMDLIHNCHSCALEVYDSPRKKLKTCESSKIPCSWSVNDIKRVQEAMFKVLRAVGGSSWVISRALRGAVYKAGSPELLDYSLKELKGKQAAPGLFVNARCISNSTMMEYRLEPGSAPSQTTITFPNISRILSYPSEQQLLQDLKCFYECLLHPETLKIHIAPSKRDLAVSSSTKILDCKQFVKDYDAVRFHSAPKEQETIHIFCGVDVIDEADECIPNPPPELLILPSKATVADLKLEAMKVFQDVYLMFRKFQIDELVGYGGVDETMGVGFLLGSTEYVEVRGKFNGKNGLGRFRMERGLERWVVDCVCGAQDDDGERMLSCDVCGIWQHTRCSGIPDREAAPTKFLCHRCRSVVNAGKSKGMMLNEVKMEDDFGEGNLVMAF